MKRTVIRGGWRGTCYLLLSFVLAGSLAACGRERVIPADQTGEIVDAQITNLLNPDYTVRRCAARALGRLGPRAKKAVPSLVCALEDAEATVRDAARLALDRIDPANKERSIARVDLGARPDAASETGDLRL